MKNIFTFLLLFVCTLTLGQSVQSTGGANTSLSAGFTGTLPIANGGTNNTVGAATLSTITNDVTTNAVMYPAWVTTASGNQAIKTSSTGLGWNPLNKALIVGTPTVTPYGDIEVNKTVNGGSNISAKNLSSGVNATSSLMAWANTARLDVVATSSTYTTTSTALGVNQAILAGNASTGGLLIGTENGSAPIKFYTDNFDIGNERLWINNSNGYIGIGSFTTAPTGAVMSKFSANSTAIRNSIQNTNSGTLAQSWHIATNNDANTYALLGTTSTGFTTSGNLVAQQPRLEFYSGNNAKSIIQVTTNSALGFYTNATERLTIAAGGNITATGNFTAGNVTSGTYTPTLTNVTNVAASTPVQLQYSRVGNYVQISGRVSIDLTTTLLASQMDMSLPIASDFTTGLEAGGVATGFADQTSNWQISCDVTNNRLVFYSTGVANTANSVYHFTCGYYIQ